MGVKSPMLKIFNFRNFGVGAQIAVNLANRSYFKSSDTFVCSKCAKTSKTADMAVLVKTHLLKNFNFRNFGVGAQIAVNEANRSFFNSSDTFVRSKCAKTSKTADLGVLVNSHLLKNFNFRNFGVGAQIAVN